MRLDLLADPRMHLTCLAAILASIMVAPGMAEVASAVEDRAFGTLDKVGHDARVAFGIEECEGHLEDEPGRPIADSAHPCLGTRLAGTLPRL